MSKAKMSTRDLITLIMLFAMTTILYADQSIMSAILPELSKTFNVDESTLGYINFAFVVVGAIMSLTFGYLADKQSRKMLFVTAVLIGEIPCILTGVEFVTPDIYWFAGLRILSGIGLGALFPITHSVLADYFTEEHRAFAAAWMGAAWGIGSALGVMVAGYLTNVNLFGLGWRIAFIIIGVPNIPIVLAFWAYAKEPERGRSEEALEELIQEGVVYKQTINMQDFKVIAANKTNLYTMIQGIPGSLPWGVFGFFLITYLRTVRGVSLEMATTIFFILGLGSTIGGVFWAYIGDRLYKKDPRYMPMLCGVVVLIGIIPTALILNITMNNTIYMVFGFITGFIVSVAAANYKAILMNVNKPENRGSVFAVSNIVADNIGAGVGTLVGSLLISKGFESMMNSATLRINDILNIQLVYNAKQFMMNFAIAWWIPCGILFLMAAKYITKDRDALQSYLAEQAKIMEKETA
ncbi:MAG TPA: MFS transporter [Desulfomonilia bacterium]|jgi:MFS family permease